MSLDSTYIPTPQTPNVSDAKVGERRKVTLKELFREYTRANPEVVAACCLGIGFALGWKLRPW
jgi:hypothetical protein